MRGMIVNGALALIASLCGSSSFGQTSKEAAEMNALRLPAAATAAPDFVQGGPAETILSQQFILHSKNVGVDFLIQVSSPYPFDPDATAKDVGIMFPNRDASATYVLDGGSAFGLYTSLGRPSFIVGIAPFGAKLGDLSNARWRDYVHVQTKDAPAPPGGEKFAAFLVDELKPFIEAHFPVDPKKAVLDGYSLGGLFTLRMLAERPNAFSGYIVGEPSVGYDPDLMPLLRAAAIKTNGQKVFFGVGGPRAPDIPLWGGVITALKTPGSRLAVEYRAFPGETHGSAEALVAASGMQWMFGLPPGAN